MVLPRWHARDENRCPEKSSEDRRAEQQDKKSQRGQTLSLIPARRLLEKTHLVTHSRGLLEASHGHGRGGVERQSGRLSPLYVMRLLR